MFMKNANDRRVIRVVGCIRSYFVCQEPSVVYYGLQVRESVISFIKTISTYKMYTNKHGKRSLARIRTHELRTYSQHSKRLYYDRHTDKPCFLSEQTQLFMAWILTGA